MPSPQPLRPTEKQKNILLEKGHNPNAYTRDQAYTLIEKIVAHGQQQKKMRYGPLKVSETSC